MNNFNYFAPTEVRFGRDVELETGEVAKKYGSRAVLVFGKNSVRKSGLLDRVEKSLQDAGIEFVEFGGAKPNPTPEHAEEGVKVALDFKADLIIIATKFDGLNDAVKKGGVMASSHVGGLSGAFIPVSEDAGMIASAEKGVLCIDKLEAMTCVCSVGLDMIAVPGDTPAETLSAIIADEASIGMVNSKTTAVRIIPAKGKKFGDRVDFGGLLGSAPVMNVHDGSSVKFIERGGRIPAPLQSLKN